MIKVLALLLLGLVDANVVNPECTSDFEEITVRENLNSPYQMSLDYDSNTLYFSESEDNDSNTLYFSESEDSEENESSKLSFLNLQTGKYRKISGVIGGFATAVDKKNHVVYLGGRDGIFKYNLEKQRAFFDGARNTSIWQLFHKDNLYFTTFPDETVYIYQNNKHEKVPELKDTRAMLIGISSQSNIYFSNSSGLFYYNNVDNKIYELGDFNINSFSLDKDDYLYFSTPSSIYYINDNKKNVVQIVSLPNIYGFVIENNNSIIYAQEEKLVRLKFLNLSCLTYLKDK